MKGALRKLGRLQLPSIGNELGKFPKEVVTMAQRHASAQSAVGSKPAMIQIDGGMLEGGGQILRNASALSAVTGTPIQINNIRAGRSNPGLRPQHLTGLQLIADVSDGLLQGALVGSTSVHLSPGVLVSGKHLGDTKTAGSCTLLAQATLPCLLYAKPGERGSISELELRGGTNAAMAPPVDYLQNVLEPILRTRFGIKLHVSLVRRGFYPRGGGVMMLKVKSLEEGQSLPPINLTERGNVSSIKVHAFGSDRLAGKEATILQAAVQDLRSVLGVDAPITTSTTRETKDTAFGTGAGCLITVETDTGCILGSATGVEKGLDVTECAHEAAAEVIEAVKSGACVDQWMQDQLIIFMALAEGTSRIHCTEPTLHARTAMVIAEKLLNAKFSLVNPGRKGALWLVECTGAGVKRPS